MVHGCSERLAALVTANSHAWASQPIILTSGVPRDRPMRVNQYGFQPRSRLAQFIFYSCIYLCLLHV